MSSDLTFTCNNDTCISGEEKLEFKGNINGSGTVLLFKDGNIALCLESSDYATLKNINDERLSTTEQGTCEFNDETKEYSVNASVSAKVFEELQNQYTVLNNTYMNGKQALAEAITSMGVETNSDLTLEEMAENVTNISTGNPNVRYNEETNYIQILNDTGGWINIYKTDELPISTNEYLINYNDTGISGGWVSTNGVSISEEYGLYTQNKVISTGDFYRAVTNNSFNLGNYSKLVVEFYDLDFTNISRAYIATYANATDAATILKTFTVSDANSTIEIDISDIGSIARLGIGCQAGSYVNGKFTFYMYRMYLVK